MNVIVKHCVSCETHTDDEALREQLKAQGIRLYRQAPRRRRQVKHAGKLCSKCLTNPPQPGQRYCSHCHKLTMRDYRARVKERNAELRAKLAAYESAMS